MNANNILEYVDEFLVNSNDETSLTHNTVPTKNRAELDPLSIAGVC